MQRMLASICLVFVTFTLLGCQKTLDDLKSGWENWSPLHRSRVVERVQYDFQFRTVSLGSPVFIRIFKEPSILELWIQEDGTSRYALYKEYPICNFSGHLGPKLKEGDKQSPEGFYYVTPQSMNPNSQHHLSFNLGFPNKLDQSLGRTGSLLMVHGGCKSVGCYAMTDPAIEEIYAIVEMAHKRGQYAVPVHIFPFPLTDEAMRTHILSSWSPFWKNIRTGYEYFETTKRPPRVLHQNGQYVFKAQP